MRTSLIKRFMRAFVKGIWGEVADRVVETLVCVAGIAYVVIQSGASWQKLVSGRSEALTVGVWAIAALVAWHAFRSAHSVAREVASEHPNPYSYPRQKLYGIASALTVLAIVASYFSWVRGPTPSSTKETSPMKPPILSTPPAPPVPRGAFDRILPQWKLTYRPDLLTLRDLFLIDSGAPGTANSGTVFVDPAIGLQTRPALNKRLPSVDYAISVSVSGQSKFLSFYLSRNDTQTKDICKYLAEHYDYVLKNTTQMDITSKGPGDSGTLSSKDAVFTGVIYIYHETYLPAEDAVEVTKVYKEHNLSVILRSIDYLTEKKNEATVLELRREQTSR